MKKLILIFSLCLIVLGLYSGEFRIVMVKAANICMECIGIG